MYALWKVVLYLPLSSLSACTRHSFHRYAFGTAIYLSISIRSIRPLVTMLTSCLHADLSVVVLIVSMGGLPTLARILSHHLVLGLPRLLLPSIFPCIMIFSRLLSAFITRKRHINLRHYLLRIGAQRMRFVRFRICPIVVLNLSIRPSGG